MPSPFSGALKDMEKRREAAPATLSIVGRSPTAAVRRLLAEVGYPVQELVRTDIGAVSLGDQRPGSIRVLGRKEIGELYKAVGL